MANCRYKIKSIVFRGNRLTALENITRVVHSRHFFSKSFRSYVLFALFGAYELDLLAIETADDFKNFYFILL